MRVSILPLSRQVRQVVAPVGGDLVEHRIEDVDAGSHSAEVVAAGAIVHDLRRLHLGLLLEFVDDLPLSIVIGSQCDFGSHRTPFYGPRP